MPEPTADPRGVLATLRETSAEVDRRLAMDPAARMGLDRPTVVVPEASQLAEQVATELGATGFLGAARSYDRATATATIDGEDVAVVFAMDKTHLGKISAWTINPVHGGASTNASFSVDRAPKAIAKDLRRRLLDPMSALIAEARTEEAEQERRIARRDEVVESLCSIGHALSVCRPSHAQSTVDLSMPAAPGTPRWLRAEFEVRSAGSEYEQVNVTLDGLSADQATELVQMLARWAEQ